MPLRKTQSGWMWGSKGPFPTKAKALSVARAAYAHGYKGEDHKDKDLQINEQFSTNSPRATDKIFYKSGPLEKQLFLPIK